MNNNLKDFQYKILHEYLALNPLLQKMKIKDSYICSFCKVKKETISRICFQCTYIKTLLESFEILINTTNIQGFELTEKKIIFGINEECLNKILSNLLLLLLKYYIYRCRFDNTLRIFENLLKYTKWNFLVEKHVFANKGKREQFLKKWEDVMDFL